MENVEQFWGLRTYRNGLDKVQHLFSEKSDKIMQVIADVDIEHGTWRRKRLSQITIIYYYCYYNVAIKYNYYCER